MAKLADQWWQNERLQDTRGWGIAISTARLLCGEQVAASDAFPTFTESQDELTPEQQDAMFATFADSEDDVTPEQQDSMFAELAAKG